LRGALFGGDWASDVVWLLVWAVVLTPLSLLAFVWALGHARRAGTMAEY
jgi:hypothetical protein